MKKLFIIPKIVLLLAVAHTSCKKTKLTGEYSGLAGNWEWVGGWSDDGNTNFKLNLLEKGKYTLYNGNDKIDSGRLIEEDGKLTFESNTLFHKGYFSGKHKHQIVLVKNDSLFIGNDHIADFPSSVYVKR